VVAITLALPWPGGVSNQVGWHGRRPRRLPLIPEIAISFATYFSNLRDVTIPGTSSTGLIECTVFADGDRNRFLQ
jgi:hypothetical protein